MRLYQAEWCPFSHRVRAKLTELGVDYRAVNVPASASKRTELEELTGGAAIPVLVDGDRVISDSDEILSHLEASYEADPEEVGPHARELSPTVFGTTSLSVDETVRRLREDLAGEGIEVLEDLDLSSLLGSGAPYRVLFAADRALSRLAFEANPGAVPLALIKVAVYEQGGSTRLDAVEPEKAAQQVRDPEANERGLELRKLFIRLVKALENRERDAS